jgi:hypothetical protein
VWALVVCPARRKPGSRQPEQYALDRGVGQIPPARQPDGLIIGETGGGHYLGPDFLLQSKVGRYDEPDQHICGVAAPFRSPRRQSAVLDRGDGTRSILRVGATPRGSDGTGLAEVRVPKWFFVYNRGSW